MVDIRLTFALSGEFVTKDVDLVDGSVLFKHFAQVVLVHGTRDLSHEHLDGIRVRLIHPIASAVHPEISKNYRQL